MLVCYRYGIVCFTEGDVFSLICITFHIDYSKCPWMSYEQHIKRANHDKHVYCAYVISIPITVYVTL